MAAKPVDHDDLGPAVLLHGDLTPDNILDGGGPRIQALLELASRA